ncbi:MAG: hypothetical protein GF331_25495 [Chitinivibrionales bacterium]|nr:hypothetical protein [Chitinivibrionales bacterium]
MHRVTVVCCAILTLAGSAPLTSAFACSVPVFRYALERWHPDPYEAVVFHRGLSPADSARLTRLHAAGGRQSSTNLVVRTSDVTDTTVEDQRRTWAARRIDSLPLVVLYAPHARRNAQPVWSAPLTDEAISALLDSPIRREIARRILGGETAIFVLVPSGDRAQDRAVMDTLRASLSALEKKLELPKPVYDASYFEPSKGVPLKITFSTLVVSPHEPSEQVLLHMLFGQSFDPDSLRGPTVYPVFGRGRVLIQLHADQITARNINEICRFLTGPCACTVKQANPGNDMLFTAQWDAELRRSPSDQSEPMPPLTGLSSFAREDTSTPDDAPPSEAAPAKTDSPSPPPRGAPSAQSASAPKTETRKKSTAQPALTPTTATAEPASIDSAAPTQDSAGLLCPVPLQAAAPDSVAVAESDTPFRSALYALAGVVILAAIASVAVAAARRKS